MKLRKASSIDKIFEEVKDYDLVLTVEAPLADALNARLDEPRLGIFATTPRRLVYRKNQNQDLSDRRQLFIQMIKEYDLSWKQVYYLLENILGCWQETGELREILRYERFDDELTREFIRKIENTENIYSAMENCEVEEGVSTAVIGLYQFNELDKKVLPEEYTEIELFDEGTGILPWFQIFGTTTGIIQAVRRNISRENANDIALVVPPESEYQSLLRSVFQTDGIPFLTRTDFAENEDLRTFLSLLRSSLFDNRLRVRNVQPLLRKLDLHVPEKFDEEFLGELELDEVEDFMDIMRKLRGSTFGESLDYYEEFVGRLKEIREALSEIEYLHEEVTEESLNRLEYYLDSFDIQAEKSQEGVLFASPKSVSHIDRPIILYLGMDSLWTHTRPEKPWVDKDEFEERNLKNFELLLQNGEQQYFLVRDSKRGEEVTPCLYFDEIFDQEFDSFSDLPNTENWGLERKPYEGFEKKDFGVEIEPVRLISQSGLNDLVQSPRQYFFSRLIPTKEKDYLKKGALFHDFAEFYVNYPEMVHDMGLDEFVEIMVGEINPHVDDFDLDRMRTEFRVGLENITDFLNCDIPARDFSDYEKRNGNNVFARHFGKSTDLSIAEAWFENYKLGGKGKVDLIKEGDQLVDYKSGRRKSAGSIVKNSKVDLFEDYPDFQAILYLAHHRQKGPNKKLKFTFFHFSDNKEDKISGNPTLEDNLVTITYYPRRFQEQIYKREIYDRLSKNVSETNDRRKTLEKLGFEKYRRFFETHDFPGTYDRGDLLESEFTQGFIEYCQNIVGDYKYVKKGCRSALSKILAFREKNYFQEDIDEFEEFLKKQLEDLNEYKKGRFPVGEVDPDDLENTDLIIGDSFEA